MSVNLPSHSFQNTKAVLIWQEQKARERKNSRKDDVSLRNLTGDDRNESFSRCNGNPSDSR
jgi:hypothetical protein